MFALIILITFAPVLILFSISLTIFATFTTTLALSTLFLRALFAYAELAVFLASNQFALRFWQLIIHSESSSASTSIIFSSAEKPLIISGNGLDRPDSRRSKLSHGNCISSNGPLTPRLFGESNMSRGGVYGRNSAAVFGQRDFEGVGGWSMEDSDDEGCAPWAVINTRLELPSHVAHERRETNHYRSVSSLSFIPTRPTSWHALTPSSSRPTTWHAQTLSGSAYGYPGGDHTTTIRSSRPISWHTKTPPGSTYSNLGVDYFSTQRSSQPLG